MAGRTPDTFTERMLRRAINNKKSPTVQNKPNQYDALADVSVVSSLTAEINDIDNDIVALGIPMDTLDEKLYGTRHPKVKQMHSKRKQVPINSNTFIEKKLRLSTSSCGKRIPPLDQLKMDEADDPLDEALYELDNEINNNPDVLKKSFAPDISQKICPLQPIITISAPAETENISSGKIIETPKTLRHSSRSNLVSTKKSSTENPARLYPVLDDNDLSPILSKSDNNNKENTNSNLGGNNLLVVGKKINSPDSQLSGDVKSALLTLENVIGNNLNNTSLTFDPSPQSTSEFTASDLISPEKTPLFQRIVNRFSGKKRPPLPSIADNNDDDDDGGGGGNEDEPMNNRNNTFNRSTRLYKSFSRKIKDGLKNTLGRNDRPAAEMSPEVLEQITFSKTKSGEIDKIILKIKVEQEAINQARKALVHCHSNVKFLGSKAEIESERILLIASIKKDLLTEELKILSGRSNDSLDKKKLELFKTSCGDITIDKICLTLKNILRKKPNHGDVADWFVAVITEGNNVWASSPITCKIDNPIIEFDKLTVNINNLHPNFKIKIEVYNLKLKTGRNYDDDDSSVKRNFNNLQFSKTSVFPSPKRFLKKNDKSLTPKISRVTCTSFPTSFQLSGYAYLTVKDINSSGPWVLNDVPNDSLLLGTIHLNLSAKININVCHKGFLTQCGENGGVPTRDVRWCVLSGRKLLLWKYKDDEEEKPPVMTINLDDCVTKKIGVTNEILCAKPRTMLIETKREKNSNDCNSMIFDCKNEWTIVRHFLSCDTKKDLDEWIYKLNYALSLMNEWKDDSVSQFAPPEASIVSAV